MNLTGKQRAYLRRLANGLDTIVHVGKEGIGENLLRQVSDALEKRELIKGRVLDNNPDYDARQAAEIIAQATQSQIVQVIGSKFVLYRQSTSKPRDERISLTDMPKHPSTTSNNQPKTKAKVKPNQTKVKANQPKTKVKVTKPRSKYQSHDTRSQSDRPYHGRMKPADGTRHGTDRPANGIRHGTDRPANGIRHGTDNPRDRRTNQPSGGMKKRTFK